MLRNLARIILGGLLALHGIAISVAEGNDKIKVLMRGVRQMYLQKAKDRGDE